MMNEQTLDVLLVEDNPGDARLVEEMLREARGFLHRISLDESSPDRSTVHHESTLEAGIERLEEDDIDVILLDLGLPGYMGLDTLVRMLEKTEFTPVVVLTGTDDRELGTRAIQSGAQDYLVKDEVSGELLVHSIQYAIEQTRQHRERVRYRRHLERLDQLNRISQDITHDVITTSTREGLEQAVCDRFVAADGFDAAWIGHLHQPSEQLKPRAIAGWGGQLPEVLLDTDSGVSDSTRPEVTALRNQELEVLQDVEVTRQEEPWLGSLADRGIRGLISLPIAHSSVVYGILTVYASTSISFDAREREILIRLGENIGHAVTAIERREALLQDTVLQLRFRLEGIAEELVGFSLNQGCIIEFENIIRSDRGGLVYGRGEGVSEEEFRRVAGESPLVDDLRILGSQKEAFEFELVSWGIERLLTAVATHGGQVASASIEDGEFLVTIEFPTGRDKHQLVDLVETHCEAAGLEAQRTVERDGPGVADPNALLDEQLTEKQYAALEAAYHAGYFEWPRATTGEEIADRLGITQATFSQHFRAAERTFFDAVFGSRTEGQGESHSPWRAIETDGNGN